MVDILSQPWCPSIPTVMPSTSSGAAPPPPPAVRKVTFPVNPNCLLILVVVRWGYWIISCKNLFSACLPFLSALLEKCMLSLLYTLHCQKSHGEIPGRAASRSRPFLSKAGVEILRRLRLFPIEFFYTEIIKWLPVPGAGDRSGPKADRLRNTVDFYFSTFLQCLTCFFTSKASKVNLFVYDEISSVSFKFNSSLLKDREKNYLYQ